MKYTIIMLFLFVTLAGVGQNTSSFPSVKIDTAIVNHRELHEKLEMLKTQCNWAERIGGKIDVFWLKNERGNYFAYVYEYIFDCDNLRLIYWYHNTGEQGAIVDFMIEDAEDESDFVVNKKKHLKNKKKYQKYFGE